MERFQQIDPDEIIAKLRDILSKIKSWGQEEKNVEKFSHTPSS